MMKATMYLQRIENWDQTLTLRINRASHIAWIRSMFAIISKLGDGIFWYTLITAIMLLDKSAGLRHGIQIILTGLAATVIYKWLKNKTSRPRPFMAHGGVSCFTAPLDQYSFPSGHTMHAFTFSTMILYYYPQLIWVVLPFTLLVALSRVVLGLHYPTDVLAGALLGTAVAAASLTF